MGNWNTPACLYRMRYSNSRPSCFAGIECILTISDQTTEVHNAGRERAVTTSHRESLLGEVPIELMRYRIITMNLPKEDLVVDWAGHITLEQIDGQFVVKDYQSIRGCSFSN
jgi:hypothetical protein